MAVIKQVLNQKQIAFLESNFVVYDPLYRECYQDFNGLENCQVILMGEYHNSSVLKTIQRQFLEIIVEKQPICMLAEGLTPGVTLNAQETAQWRGLPAAVQVRGADVRAQWNSAQFTKWEKLNHRIIQLELEDKARVSVSFRQLAGLLNGHFRSGSAEISKAKKMVGISDEVVKMVEEQLAKMMQEKEQRDQEIEKIHRQMNQLIQYKITDPTVVRSNVTFFQEIERACKQFSKVIAIWGKGHFVCDEELRRALDQARLSYVILFPNIQRERDALDEIMWAKGTMLTGELMISGKKEEITFKVPKIFQTYFHPALQTACIMETKEPIVLDIEKLIKLSQKGTVLNFPAEQDVHFEHVPLADFQKLEELCQGLEQLSKLTTERSRAMKGYVISMLNNILMLGGLKVDSLMFEGSFICDFNVLQNKLVLTLSSDKPFCLKLTKGQDIFGYASYLFQEMKRLYVKEYPVSPAERLFFFDLSIEERNRILKSSSGIIDWLQSKLPPQSHLKLEGDISIQSAKAEPFSDHPAWEGIALITKTGFKLTLT